MRYFCSIKELCARRQPSLAPLCLYLMKKVPYDEGRKEYCKPSVGTRTPSTRSNDSRRCILPAQYRTRYRRRAPPRSTDLMGNRGPREWRERCFKYRRSGELEPEGISISRKEP